MTLPKEYLEYPLRRYGYDHDLYDWSILFKRKPVEWPNGAKMAVWITTELEYFGLDQPAKPFKAPGGMVTPYPDLRHFTTRDYGNRVGIQRIWTALDKYKIRSSAVINSKVAERYPYLVNQIKTRGDEVIAGGVDMSTLHYGGMDDATEAAQVKTAVDTLRKLTGQKVRGWLSPAKSESFNTLKHLAANGIEYVCDWSSDDMPFEMRAGRRQGHRHAAYGGNFRPQDHRRQQAHRGRVRRTDPGSVHLPCEGSEPLRRPHHVAGVGALHQRPALPRQIPEPGAGLADQPERHLGRDGE